MSSFSFVFMLAHSFALFLYLCICNVHVRTRVCVCLRFPCKALQEPEKETEWNEPVTMVIAHLPYRSALPHRLDRCQNCQRRNTYRCPLQRFGQSHSLPDVCLVTSLTPSASCAISIPKAPLWAVLAVKEPV